MKHVINAENKKLGRVASDAAKILMGKNTPEFVRNAAPAVEVHIENASKLSVDDTKLDNKIYKNFSGYPGGLKEETMKRIVEKKGYGEVLRNAIYGMLPHNKLRPRMMKNVTITE